MIEEDIAIINEVIANYFESDPSKDWITAKEVMPQLIEKGVFRKDKKNGQPLRKLFISLNKVNELDKIPSVHAEQKEGRTYWYIVKEGAKYVSPDPVNAITKKQQRTINRENSDEYYVLNLCDEILGHTASRQHTFKFLLGDEHKDGKTKSKLAIDAFYKKLSLAIECYRKQTRAFEKTERITTSGVSRAEQRKIYDERKKSYLEDKGIDLIHIDYNIFKSTKENKLKRDLGEDSKILTKILEDYIK